MAVWFWRVSEKTRIKSHFFHILDASEASDSWPRLQIKFLELFLQYVLLFNPINNWIMLWILVDLFSNKMHYWKWLMAQFSNTQNNYAILGVHLTWFDCKCLHMTRLQNYDWLGCQWIVNELDKYKINCQATI